MNGEASKYPGFLGAEINPPTAVQPEWVVVYRFDSIAHVQAWINSATRQERLAAGQQYFDGPGTQQVLGGGARHADPLVTVVVTPPRQAGGRRRVPRLAGPAAVGGERVSRASAAPSCSARSRVSRRNGPRSTATTMPTDLDKWLISDERQDSFSPRARSSPTSTPAPSTTRSAAGSPSTSTATEAPPPSDIKTSIAVWVGLYPTVVLLILALSPLKMPLWLSLLVGNLLSSFTMTLRDDAVLREPAAEALATTTARMSASPDELARHRHRCRRRWRSGPWCSTW